MAGAPNHARPLHGRGRLRDARIIVEPAECLRKRSVPAVACVRVALGEGGVHEVSYLPRPSDAPKTIILRHLLAQEEPGSP